MAAMAVERAGLQEVLHDIYTGGFPARAVRRLEHLAIAECLRTHGRKGKHEVIEEFEGMLGVASAAMGRRIRSAVLLQRLLKEHGHDELARRVAGRARGRHAAAHPDPGLEADLHETLLAVRLRASSDGDSEGDVESGEVQSLEPASSPVLEGVRCGGAQVAGLKEQVAEALGMLKAREARVAMITETITSLAVMCVVFAVTRAPGLLGRSRGRGRAGIGW